MRYLKSSLCLLYVLLSAAWGHTQSVTCSTWVDKQVLPENSTPSSDKSVHFDLVKPSTVWVADEIKDRIGTDVNVEENYKLRVNYKHENQFIGQDIDHATPFGTVYILDKEEHYFIRKIAPTGEGVTGRGFAFGIRTYNISTTPGGLIPYVTPFVEADGNTYELLPPNTADPEASDIRGRQDYLKLLGAPEEMCSEFIYRLTWDSVVFKVKQIDRKSGKTLVTVDDWLSRSFNNFGTYGDDFRVGGGRFHGEMERIRIRQGVVKTIDWHAAGMDVSFAPNLTWMDGVRVGGIGDDLEFNQSETGRPSYGLKSDCEDAYHLRYCKTVAKRIFIRDSMLAASAATFTDEVPISFDEKGFDNSGLTEVSGFWNASRGVWRGDASYTYMADRDQTSGSPNIRRDGTFSLLLLDSDAPYKTCDNEWVKTTQITRYNPYGNETENKDVLGRYSSALFGYQGQLPIAVSANAREDETAFTGFEDPDGALSGNLVFRDIELPLGRLVMKHITVLAADEDVALIDYPYDRFVAKGMDNLTNVDLFSKDLVTGRQEEFQDVAILRAVAVENHPEWCYIMYEPLYGQTNRSWTGELIYGSGINEEPVTADIYGSVAHTGNYSLKITESNPGFSTGVGGYTQYNSFTAYESYPQSGLSTTLSQSKYGFDLLKATSPNNSQAAHIQYAMDLIPGEEYLFSAWVSVSDIPMASGLNDVATTDAEQIGVDISFTDVEGVFKMRPTGPIIDGWQRIEGRFLMLSDGFIKLNFRKGWATTAYFDDLRIYPADGNLQSYIYDPETYRLRATLDNNNYATLYYYDAEGNLHLLKKETVEGVKTIQESISNQIKTYTKQ